MNLPALVRVGHEVALRACRLRARSMTAEIPTWSGTPVLFSYEPRRVTATGLGYEVELSALPEWDRLRPPGT